MFVSFFLCSKVHAHRGGTLSGGLLYPPFATAAQTNASALTADWLTELQVTYSPPWTPNDPHSYLAGFAMNHQVYAFNVGYSGSTQDGVTFHNVFAGGSYRLGKLSFGIAVRKNDLLGENPVNFDVSLMYYMGRSMRLGAVIYDLTNYKQVGVGIGHERNGMYSIDLDILAPMDFRNSSLNKEIAATLAGIFYYKRLGLSFGTRYTRLETFGSVGSDVNVNTGVLFRITRNYSVIASYNTSPRAVTIGISYSKWPSPQQLIKFFVNRNQNTIDR